MGDDRQSISVDDTGKDTYLDEDVSGVSHPWGEGHIIQQVWPLADCLSGQRPESSSIHENQCE